MGSILIDPDAMGTCNPEEQLSSLYYLEVTSHSEHQPSACGTYISILHALHVSKSKYLANLCQGLYR